MNTLRQVWFALGLLACSACHAATTADVEAWIKKDLPIGSSKEQVISVLDARGIEHSGRYKPELYYDKNKTISAALRDTKKGALVTSGVFIEFRFDAADKLLSYSVKELLTGP